METFSQYNIVKLGVKPLEMESPVGYVCSISQKCFICFFLGKHYFHNVSNFLGQSFLDGGLISEHAYIMVLLILIQHKVYMVSWRLVTFRNVKMIIPHMHVPPLLLLLFTY
jgi:hypothetical protein